MEPKNKRKLSSFEAFIHLIKTTLGGGFLAMPEAFCHAGIVMGCIGITVIGAAVLNMMSFLALRSGQYAVTIAADRQERGLGNVPATPAADPEELWLPAMTYPETVEAVFLYGARGRFARYASFFKSLTSTTLLCTYYGVNIVYVCIIANTNKQLFDQHLSENNMLHNLSIRFYPALISVVVFPIGMVFNLKALVIISKVANLIIIGAASIIFYFLFGGDDRPIASTAKMIVYPASKWSLFAGTALCSLEGVGMLLKIESTMLRPKTLAGPPFYVLHWSMALILLINSLLGLVGYVYYGESVLGSIALNLPSNVKLAESVKILVALGIVLTYGLQLNVTADLLWPQTRDVINRYRPGYLDMEIQPDSEMTPEELADPTTKKNYRRMNVTYVIMRSTLIIGTIIIATIEPRIEPTISLVGSVGFSILGLIVPVIMETVWHWYPHVEDGENVDDNKKKPTPTETKDTVDPTDAIQLGCFNVNAPTNHIGMWSLWSTMRGDSTGTRPTVVAKSSRNWRAIERFARHGKNLAIFGLALFALVGGAYFNVQQIVNGIETQ